MPPTHEKDLEDQSGDQRVIPVAGFLATPDADVEHATALVLEAWGPLLLRTPPIPFTLTRFYEREMGVGLQRFWIAGQHLISPLELAAMKRLARTWENDLTLAQDTPDDAPRRTVNIDPGYVSLDQLVLASTKYAAFRLPITSGLYAEITLIYRDGHFRELPWSYRDYVEAAPFFEDVRYALKIYRRKGVLELRGDSGE